MARVCLRSPAVAASVMMLLMIAIMLTVFSPWQQKVAAGVDSEEGFEDVPGATSAVHVPSQAREETVNSGASGGGRRVDPGGSPSTDSEVDSRGPGLASGASEEVPNDKDSGGAAAGPAAAELKTEAQEQGSSGLGVQEVKAVTEQVLDANEVAALKSPSANKDGATPKVAGQAVVSLEGLDEVAVDVVPQAGQQMTWQACNESLSPTVDWADWIPCLDNEKAVSQLKARSHYQHRERHCPAREEVPRCLVPLPEGYKAPVPWPESRDQIWFSNVPHPKLSEYKKDQNWVKVQGDRMVFPGGGTQFVDGASQYIERMEQAAPLISWGNRTRVVLDVGCGVASFSAFLEDRDVRVFSMAPRDEHDAQIQFALERGILAMVQVMGTQRLPFPSNSFDLVHCSRCRVPWHVDGGMLLLELNRLLRPGGLFAWSATPVYRKKASEEKLWEAIADLTERMCWRLLVKETWGKGDSGLAVWMKPPDGNCYAERQPPATEPPLCEGADKPDAAWYVPMKACLHPIPVPPARGAVWPALGRARLESQPAWLKEEGAGIFGQPLEKETVQDLRHWQHVVRFYLQELNAIGWKGVRNVMDANAKYGGFAAVMAQRKLPAWVLSVVPVSGADTLPLIFERGLVGVYHDWCEALNTYPRTYDLIHVDHLLHLELERCDAGLLFMEMDRILRPGGWIIFREHKDEQPFIRKFAASLHWQTKKYLNQSSEELHLYQKTFWRPDASSQSPQTSQ